MLLTLHRTLFYDTKHKAPFTPFSANAEHTTFPQNTEGAAYEAGLNVVGEFKTVEGFCRYFNWLKPPSKLERSSNYHLFKDGIKPMWEDPANANGGKWVLTIKSNPQLLDRCWSWLAMALVGEELDEKDEVCGAVVSLRAKIDRIQLWTRGKDDVESINALGRKLVKLLDVSEEPGVGLEFHVSSLSAQMIRCLNHWKVQHRRQAWSQQVSFYSIAGPLCREWIPTFATHGHFYDLQQHSVEHC